jgi:hypothetical protein
MARYVEGSDRRQVTLLPECLEDWIAEDNPVRAVDAFVEELDLAALGFARAMPASTGRPAYHPAALLKIYIYGYLNRVASSRRLERECQRNIGSGSRGSTLIRDKLSPLSIAARICIQSAWLRTTTSELLSNFFLGLALYNFPSCFHSWWYHGRTR